MKFWDSSAILPLCIDEAKTDLVRQVLTMDAVMAVWWGSIVECYSAIARLRREGIITTADEDSVRTIIAILSESWLEVLPGDEIRAIASRLLLNHPLKAADSFQLAAAIQWTGKNPVGHHFVCFDNRLSDAARKEGFSVVP